NGAPIIVKDDNFAIIRIDNGKTTNRVDRSLWNIVLADSYATGNPPNRIMDGDFTSYWQPAYGDGHIGKRELPYTIVLDMGAEKEINGFEIWRRTGTYVTDLKAGLIEVS